MPMELFEDAYGDPRNAQFLALAADVCYFPEAKALPIYRDQLGLEGKLFSAGNTQAYVLTNANHIVAAFRGTESPTTTEGLKDCLITNAANFLMVPEGRLGTDFAAAGVGARFHQGFVNAIADIWEPVSAAVVAERSKSDRPIWITGHSLGGALAVLAAWLFYRKFVPVHQIYTFGGPMMGNDLAAQAFDKAYGKKAFRYVDSSDPIPKLPTVSLASNAYIHCEKEMGLGEAAAKDSALQFLGSLASKTVDGVLNATLMDDLWNGVVARLSSHSMDNYRKRLGEG